ncbi:MAG: DUF4180 domain-containing protein [Bacteroidales bacterium]|nr:DUF4180 domain-containing protein [Bacteroidales bacterium]
MKILIHETERGKIAEILSEEIIIKDTDEALDLMAESRYLDAGKMIIYEYQIDPSFFDLKTGLAGEILQKFSNYRMQLAIIGDFSKYRSKSLQDFVRECNKGNRIFFLESKEAAIAKFSTL